MSRRQRLELALSTLPYDHKSIKFSDHQLMVQELVAKLGNEEPTPSTSTSTTQNTNKIEEPKEIKEEMSSEERARQQEMKAAGFAELAMRHIEECDRAPAAPKPIKKQLCTLATLAMAAEQFIENSDPTPSNEEEAKDDEFAVDPDMVIDEVITQARADHRQLVENNLEALNDARIKILQNWEGCKLKALSLLTTEIDELLDAERLINIKMGRIVISPNKAEIDPNEQRDDDEDYVPKQGGKRKRKQRRTSTPNDSETLPYFEFERNPKSKYIIIGPQGTRLRRSFLRTVNWFNTPPAITRKLLTAVFHRQPLSMHTLSGKPSPAFKDCARPVKAKLNPVKVSDLIHFMTTTFGMTNREVRTAITTKCADENKMERARELRDNPVLRATFIAEAKKLGITFAELLRRHGLTLVPAKKRRGAKKQKVKH